MTETESEICLFCTAIAFITVSQFYTLQCVCVCVCVRVCNLLSLTQPCHVICHVTSLPYRTPLHLMLCLVQLKLKVLPLQMTYQYYKYLNTGPVSNILLCKDIESEITVFLFLFQSLSLSPPPSLSSQLLYHSIHMCLSIQAPPTNKMKKNRFILHYILL